MNTRIYYALEFCVALFLGLGLLLAAPVVLPLIIELVR